MTSSRLSRLAPLALLCALAAPAAQAQNTSGMPETTQRCGTWRLFQNASSSGRSARIAENCVPPFLAGRTLVTSHFAIHYTLGRNTHRPAWKSGDAGDAGLKAKVDSLFVVYQAANPARRDSLMNAALDSLGAPHPAFITRAAAYLESAWSYDKDTLGMRVPDSNVTTYFLGSVPGKFNVEIGDIDVLAGSDYPGTYGLTLPPTQSCTHFWLSTSLLIENDFIYGASVNISTGAISGTSIKVSATDPNTGVTSLIHDYQYDWDQGLAVTIAHEFYHAVQFQYTPSANGYHAWYELTAVGMEERLAPTVNDYLGYLPYVLGTRTPVYLLTPPPNNINYGNGIFHTFLTQALGKTFDAGVWQRLSDNGNDLPAALVNQVGSQARWDSLFAAYAASLAIAGRTGAAASPLAFSPDFALWPRIRVDTAAATPSSLSLNSLTYRAVGPVSGTVTWATAPGIKGLSRVSQTGTSFSSQFIADSIAPVTSNGALALVAANSSFTSARTLSLKRGASSGQVAAFPNPATRAAGSIHFSAPVAGSTGALTIVSESGKRMATLAADPTGSFWTWDFVDGGGQALPAGVYHYGIPGGSPQTLLVLP